MADQSPPPPPPTDNSTEPNVPNEAITPKPTPCDQMINAFVEQSTRQIMVDYGNGGGRVSATNLKCSLGEPGRFTCTSDEDYAAVEMLAPVRCSASTSKFRRGIIIQEADSTVKVRVMENNHCDEVVKATRMRFNKLRDKWTNN